MDMVQRSTGYGMKEYGIEAPKVGEIAMEVQYRMRN